MLLLIDNYDSFTYNLVHYLGELGAECKVVRNDQITVEEALALKPSGIVLSPGPGTPNEAGICLDLVRAVAQTDMPLLGVCLGHQTIGQVFSGDVIRAQRLMHGKTDQISHNGKGLFAGVPSPMTATRYHSLIVDAITLPDCFEVTAKSDDGYIMGIQHTTKPIHGLQFHPESIRTTHGHALLANFIKLTNIPVKPLPVQTHLSKTNSQEAA